MTDFGLTCTALLEIAVPGPRLFCSRLIHTLYTQHTHDLSGSNSPPSVFPAFLILVYGRKGPSSGAFPPILTLIQASRSTSLSSERLNDKTMVLDSSPAGKAALLFCSFFITRFKGDA